MNPAADHYRSRVRGLLVALAAVLLFVGHSADWWRLPLVDALERTLYDQRLRLNLRAGVDPRIVIVDIDERSLGTVGRWPWPRNRLAELVESLHGTYKVKLVGFDVVFAEQDRNEALALLDELARGELRNDAAFVASSGRLRERLDFDQRFAKALAAHPAVLGLYFNLDEGEGSSAVTRGAVRSGVLPGAAFDVAELNGHRVIAPKANGFGANLALLQTAAGRGGHFNPTVDPDGVVRRVPMLVQFEDRFFPALALEMARVLAGAKQITPGFAPGFWSGRSYPALEWLSLGGLRVPVDLHGQALVPYRGARGSFPYVSAADVLAKRVDPALLAGRIVIVGTSAPGLLDLRSSPLGPAYPGVEVHANLLAGILDGVLLQAPAYTVGAEVCLLLVFGLLAGATSFLARPAARWLAGASLLVLYAGLNYLAWRAADFVLPLAAGLLLIPLAAGMTGAWRHWVEEAGARRWHRLMGAHLPPPALRALEGRPIEEVLKPAYRQASVLRVMLVPAASGAWPDDAPELGDILATCLAPLVAVVQAQGGTFDRYLPRGFIAFWGAPDEDPGHALHALRAAENIRARQGVLLEHCAAHGWAGVGVVCGLASGPCLIGRLGAEVRRDYAAEGRPVEWAMALAGLASRYGVDIIATDATREATPDYAWQELDRLRLGEGAKGLVGVHTPHGLREAVDPSLRSDLRLLKESLRLYRARDWDAAEINFLNLRKDPRLAGPVAVYLQRIGEHRRQPPPADWDGAPPTGF